MTSQDAGLLSAAGKSWNPEEKLHQIAWCINPEYFFLRIHPDGTCTENVTLIHTGLPALESCRDFYIDKLIRLDNDRAAVFVCDEHADISQAGSINMKICIEKLYNNGITLNIAGWCNAPEIEPSALDEQLLLMAAVESAAYYTHIISRPDLSSRRGFVTGFSLCVAIKDLHEYMEIKFLLAGRKTNRMAGIYTYPYRICTKTQNFI